MDGDLRAARPASQSVDLEHRWAKLQKNLFDTAADPVKLGRFVILDRLGQGGMGVVYSAYDPQLDRRVALKLVRTSESNKARQRLEREAQALARLSHPNVVPVHEVGTLDDGRVFLVMELVTGKTLRAWVDEGTRPWREVLAVYRQAGQGLAAAHAQGMIHRDFKPENAIIGQDGRVRVLDFGLARGRRIDEPDSWDEDSSEASSGHPAVPEVSAVASTETGGSPAVDNPPAFDPVASVDPGAGSAPGLAVNTVANPAQLLHAQLTRTGAIMGTPAYMSPEQLTGTSRIGPATDQFSFCVALYEALHGKRPFAGNDLGVLAENVRAGRVREPPRTSNVPGWIFSALRRGLETEPEKRYPSMEALLDVLARDPARIRRRWLGGIAIGIAIGLVVFALTRAQPARVAVCESARDELDGIWDSAQRIAVSEALQKTRQNYAEEATPRVLAGLDAYADAWVAMHRSACLANQRGHQSDALLDKRMTCLGKRQRALANAVQVLTEIDTASIKNAVDVVQKLPSIAYCDNTEALEAEMAPPEDVVLARKVAALRDQLARAEALDHAGRYGEANELAERVVKQAEALAYGPVLAEALLAQGKTQIDKRPRDKAIEPLHRAMLLGFEAGWNRVALEALALRVFAEGMQKTVGPELRAYIPVAEAMVQNLADATYVHGLLLNNIGTMYLAHDELDQARTYFQHAIAIKENAREPDPVELANGLLNLGLVAERDSEREALLQHAAELYEKTLGPSHPMTLGARRVYAQHIRNPLPARDGFESVCTATERYHPDRTVDLAICFYQLGHLNAELGDLERAAESFSHIQRIGTDDKEELGQWHRMARGYELLERGNYQAAAIPFQQALDQAESEPQPWWVREIIAQAELGLGLGLQGTGDYARATRVLEQAMRSFQDVEASTRKVQVRQFLARTRMALASVLWRQPVASGANPGSSTAEARARASALVAEAEAWYRDAGPGYEWQLAQVAAWRSERGISP